MRLISPTLQHIQLLLDSNVRMGPDDYVLAVEHDGMLAGIAVAHSSSAVLLVSHFRIFVADPELRRRAALVLSGSLRGLELTSRRTVLAMLDSQSEVMPGFSVLPMQVCVLSQERATPGQQAKRGEAQPPRDNKPKTQTDANPDDNLDGLDEIVKPTKKVTAGAQAERVLQAFAKPRKSRARGAAGAKS
jgi:hypothetical protein